MVKYQKYRLSKSINKLIPNLVVKKIERMKPELVMLSENHGNKQYLIASDEEEFNKINSKKAFLNASKKKKANRNFMGKRTYLQMQNLNRLEEDDEDLLTEYELKKGI